MKHGAFFNFLDKISNFYNAVIECNAFAVENTQKHTSIKRKNQIKHEIVMYLTGNLTLSSIMSQY